MTVMIPGVEQLKLWLKDQNVSPYRFALEHKLDPSTLNKLFNGRQKSVSVEFAAMVEDATEGAILMRAWIPLKNGEGR